MTAKNSTILTIVLSTFLTAHSSGQKVAVIGMNHISPDGLCAPE